MSEAIRCGQCRWWRRENEDHGGPWGRCELNPAVFLQETDLVNGGWKQPAMYADEGCSRGKPKAEDAT
jgi:hypothetical protein